MLGYATGHANPWVGVVASLFCAAVALVTPTRKWQMKSVKTHPRWTKLGVVTVFVALAAVWYLLR